MQKPLKIVFMGTPDFAAFILKQLCHWNNCEVIAVYCQPDRPSGRGNKTIFSPVKKVALEFGINVLQPLNFKHAQDVEFLQDLQPDLLVVAAYGLILPQAVLDIPTIAPLNVHASLLPLYRGAAPIQRAIMDGMRESGVSIMKMEASLDTGPVYAMHSTEILNHTASSLHDELAQLGAKILIDVLTRMQTSRLTPTPQDHSLSSYATKLSKHDGIINWDRSAQEVDAQIRGVTNWPGAQVSLFKPDNEKLDLRIAPGRIGPAQLDYASFFASHLIKDQSGQLLRLEKDVIAISTLDYFYILHEVKPVNKGFMLASDFARGYFGPELGFLANA